MELPELPVVLNWIFKLLAITGVIYLSKKYQAEIKEAASYFRYEVWICIIFAATMVVSALTNILFTNDHELGDRIFNVLHLAIKLGMGLLIVLMISRIIYKKKILQNPA